MITLLLFIFLLILLGYIYMRFSRDIFSPPVIKIGVFIFSTLVVLLNSNVWHLDISISTLFLIFSGLIVFSISSLYAKIKYNNSNKKTNLPQAVIRPEILGTSRTFYFLSTVFMMFNAIIYYIYVYNTALTYGSDGNVFTMLGYFRNAEIWYHVEMPSYLVTINLISNCLTIFYIMIFANNYINHKKNFRYLIPVLIYISIAVISSNRVGFITIIASTLVMVFVISSRLNKKIKNKTVIKRSLLALSAFFIIFLQLGTLTGKSQNYDNPFQNISIYAGSSIVALDSYVSDYTYNIKNFGSETIYGINNLFNRVGIETDANSRFLEFRTLGDMPNPTNVYTCYRRLLHDYGYAGLYIIELISGYLLTLFYLKLRGNNFRNFYYMLLVYTFFFYALAMSAIEEKLIVNLFTISTLLTFGLFYIFTKYFLKKYPTRNSSKEVTHAS